ncbi:MAG: protein kinase [Burkholderiales bacterium]|nr:protein kinase [Burkholderiales bacterium]
MSDNETADYARLKDAFLELLDLDPLSRTERLHHHAKESPALAAALRHQLDASAHSLPLLDHAGDGPGVPELAHYRILRELGRGGMGIVWLAERELGDATQTVALKQIAHAHWGEEDLRRFKRERRILASLDHPHIAALVDGGSDDQGKAFLATQYVAGERLDRWCEMHAAGVRTRIELMHRIVAAVEYAHGQLVVHRDLKPANILVTADGTPKLLDFGIARALHEDAVTRDGNSQMTLRYAAPEQVASDGGDGGVSVDVYALGVLLYELLAQASPYGDTATAAALIHAILHEDPVAPSRSASALPGVDADLDAICLKALRKRPQDRYAGANELRADLQRWLTREPVDARRGERGYRIRTFVQRRWPWLVAAGVLLGLAGYHWLTLNRQLERVAEERDRAQALALYFGELFKGARPADTVRGEVSARELLERSVQHLESDTRQAPATRAALLLAASDALAHLGQHQSGLAAIDRALQLLESAAQPDPALRARALTERASHHYKLGDLDQAQAAIAQSLALLKDLDEPDMLLSSEQQAAVYADDAGDHARARAAYQRIAEIAASRLSTPSGLRSYLAAQSNLALDDLRIDNALAERRLRDALAIEQRHGPADPALVIPMRTYLARTLVNQRKLDEARPLFERVLADARAHYSPGDPWLDVITYHYATLAFLDGRSDEAIALMDASIARDPPQPEDTDASAWSNRAHRATAALMHGDWQDAITRLQLVLARRERTGTGQGSMARFERAQLAYARCRLEPVATRASELRAALKQDAGWKGWIEWRAPLFARDCDAAVAAALRAT